MIRFKNRSEQANMQGAAPRHTASVGEVGARTRHRRLAAQPVIEENA